MTKHMCEVFGVRARRRGIAAVAAAAVSLALSAPGAGADPAQGDTVVLTCDGSGAVTVQATTYGEWLHAAEPRLVVDTTQVLIAYQFDYRFVPADGGAPIEVAGGKPAPQNGRLDVCRFAVDVPAESSHPAGRFSATYWVSFTKG